MNICVFGASGDELAPEYFAAGETLGAALARRGHTLIFGGGAHGLMGAAARGATSFAGEIVGVAPTFFDKPGIFYTGCTRFVRTETMAERKSYMEDVSDAFIALPGGVGTFEEFFEVLTLKQLGRHAKPIALLNVGGYFDELNALLRASVAKGFTVSACLSFYESFTEPEACLDYLESYLPPHIDLWALKNYR